jgi:hypothetical protein
MSHSNFKMPGSRDLTDLHVDNAGSRCRAGMVAEISLRPYAVDGQKNSRLR